MAAKRSQGPIRQNFATGIVPQLSHALLRVMGNLLTCCVEEGGVLAHHGIFKKVGNWLGNENERYVILNEGLLTYYKRCDARSVAKMKRDVVFQDKKMTLEILGIIDLLTYELIDPFARNTSTMVFSRVLPKMGAAAKKNPLLEMRDKMVGNLKELEKSEDTYTFEASNATMRMEWAAFIEEHRLYAKALQALA